MSDDIAIRANFPPYFLRLYIRSRTKKVSPNARISIGIITRAVTDSFVNQNGVFTYY